MIENEQDRPQIVFVVPRSWSEESFGFEIKSKYNHYTILSWFLFTYFGF